MVPRLFVYTGSRIFMPIYLSLFMEEDLFRDLLKRYREGDTTPEEARLLEAYYKGFDAKPDVTDSMSGEELEQLREAIRKGISPGKPLQPRRKSPVFRIQWKRLAAASVVLLVCGTFIFKYFSDSDAVTLPVAVSSSRVPAVKANNLVQLPDGSTVILSPGSTLDFPDSFDGMPKREVALTGEAYFDVRRIPDKPFIVRSGKLRTTVLGTAFNVKAMPGEKSITVTVISGKVQVGDEKETLGVLSPDEQMVYHVPDARKDVKVVDANTSVIWKYDDLYCDDITIEQAALLIEERYKVRVQIADDRLKGKRFTTTFGKEETLENVLNSLAVFNDAAYTIDDIEKRVTLSAQ